MEISSSAIEVVERKPKPNPARTLPSVLFAQEDGDRAVIASGTDLETLLGTSGMGASDQARLFSAVGSALGAGPRLPFKLIAIGIRHNALFDRAISGSMRTGDTAELIGSVLEIGKALSKVAGFEMAAHALDFGSKIAFFVGDTQEEIVLAVRSASDQDEKALRPIADNVRSEFS